MVAAVAHCKKDSPAVSMVISKRRRKVEGNYCGNEVIEYGQKENKPKYQDATGDELTTAGGKQHPNSNNRYSSAMN